MNYDSTEAPNVDLIEYGFDVGRLIRLLGVKRENIPALLEGMDLPSPSHSALNAWLKRGSCSGQWVAILLLALRMRGVKVDIYDLIRKP